MSGKLFVVGTPIGNLEDFSPRAQRILDSVDFIAAEDTRVTVKLLNRFGIKKELCSYFEHNKKESGIRIINRLLGGESCALVTDAGMPAISDPGEELVRIARENGVPVESVPGPSAAITALAVSGMPSGRFCFEGFLPTEKKERSERLSELRSEQRTMIFYEAPHKLKATLRDLCSAFGDREISLARELTKLHETVSLTTLEEANKYYEANEPRGEYVLIIRGADRVSEREYTLDEAVNIANELISKGASAASAAKEASALTGLRKNEIYKNMIK